MLKQGYMDRILYLRCVTGERISIEVDKINSGTETHVFATQIFPGMSNGTTTCDDKANTTYDAFIHYRQKYDNLEAAVADSTRIKMEVERLTQVSKKKEEQKNKEREERKNEQIKIKI